MNSPKADSGSEEKEVRLAPRRNAPVPADVYDELLDRYERVLVFAGQLQEKNRQQLLLQERNKDLEGELEILKRQVALEESYARLLENALRAVGVLKD
jgi:hypothetical protein